MELFTPGDDIEAPCKPGHCAVGGVLGCQVSLQEKSKVCLDLLHPPPLQQVQHVRAEQHDQVQEDSLHTILESRIKRLQLCQHYLCPASYSLDPVYGVVRVQQGVADLQLRYSS